MLEHKFLRLISISLLAIVLTPSLVSASNWLPLTQAQLQQPNRVIFPPTADRGAPSRTRGTGSRGSCDGLTVRGDDIPLTAITPTNNVETSISANPAVYIYVPETVDKEAEFALYDLTNRREEPTYTVTFPVSNTPGLLKIQLPETVKLEAETTYTWYFGIICNPDERSLDEYINGWIERTSLTAEQEAKLALVQQNPLAQIRLYAEAGVWHEALTLAEQLRESNPTAWKQLLESVGLGEFAEEPVSNCCKN